MAMYRLCIEKVYRKVVDIECGSEDPDVIMTTTEMSGVFEDPEGWSEEEYNFRTIYEKGNKEPLWED